MTTTDPADEPSRSNASRAVWQPWTWALHWQILLGLIVGAGIGWGLGVWAVGRLPADVAPADRGREAGTIVVHTFTFTLLKLLGDLFLRALQLIIVPLVFSSIVLAIANLGGGGDFRRLGIKTLGFYLATSLIAVLIGLTFVNVVTPGISGGVGILQGQDLSAFDDARAEIETRTGGRDLGDFLNVFRQMVPPNLIAAAADNGQLLGMIVVAIVVGYFLTRLINERRLAVERLVAGVYDLTLLIVGFVLRLAPVGVLCLIAATVAEQYARLYPDARFGAFLRGVGLFAGVAAGSLATHFLVTMPLILRLLARVSPTRHYRAMTPALLTAFSTASSSATLPLTMRCVQERAGVSERVTGFTLPLGATVNMDGTALYECVAAVFICQAFGVDLTFAQQFMIVVVALLTSVGVAGVPSASLVAIAVILSAVQAQLPADAVGVDLLAGMALLFVFDRPLDMMRTAVNVFGDSAAAVTIAKSEGEHGVLLTVPPVSG